MRKRMFYHLLFWAGYALFKTYLDFISAGPPVAGETSWNVFTIALAAQSSLLLVKIPMVYTLLRIIDQYLAKKINILKAGIAIVILFAISIDFFLLMTHFVTLPHIYNIPGPQRPFLTLPSLIYALFVLCFVAGTATTLKLIRYSIRQKDAGQEIMKKKLETELRFLKSQTNPHFLFNTLNNIYALARKKSEETADVVMKLSKLLRFMLYESQNASILITTELKMIEDYIKLEEIRYDERLKITYQHTIDDHSQTIAPLILLPFVENAFKYGASETRFDSFINIDIKLQEEQLNFTIENLVAGKQERNVMEKIGLNNVSRQLELMYPGHLLNIENDGNRFKVFLKINLRKYATV